MALSAEGGACEMDCRIWARVVEYYPRESVLVDTTVGSCCVARNWQELRFKSQKQRELPFVKM
jgi:hypothetical protein